MKRSFLAAITFAGVAVVSAAALGAGCGSKPPQTASGGAGQPGGPDAGDGSAWGGAAPDSNSSGTEEGPTSGPAASMPDAMPAPAVEPEGFYFDLQNASTTGELVFAVDKGWQPVLFAYSGKPPKAKELLLFPKACTAACDVRATDPAAEVCPVCKVEEDHKKRKQQERDETKREIAPPGGHVMVPWDGQAVVYEKVKDGKRRCECWRPGPVPPNTYTIKACGLRPSTEAGVPSSPVCAQATVMLPLPPEQRSQAIVFPEPVVPKKKKK